MSDAIKPALSAEEWAAESIRREAPNGDVLVIVRDKNPSTQEAGGHHHALAALGLVDKPFGFSHEDVALLETAEMSARNASAYVEANALALLRSRIEALLPPDKVTY